MIMDYRSTYKIILELDCFTADSWKYLFYVSSYIKNSIYNVQVVCPTGYYDGIYRAVTQWQTLWGDGI